MNQSIQNSDQQKVQLHQYTNSWYSPGRSALICALWYFINVAFFKNSWIPISAVKVFWLRAFGGKIGTGVNIKPNVNIKYPWLLEIGNYCWIGEGVWIDNLTHVKLGNHVCLSQGAMLLTGNHNYKKAKFDLIVGPIVLEDGVWIGAKAVVCPAVTCFNHSILSVGSVATQPLEAYTIYQGNPAIMVRKRVLN
jgi:putative colanic acid biosynthesis acetyltransferase WcaF